MAVDGSLIFDTKIDSDGFEKGTEKLSSKVIDLKNKISATEREIANLSKELEKMANTPIKSNVTEKLEKDIAKTKNQLKSLYEEADRIGNTKKADLTSMGFGTEHLDDILSRDESWNKVQKQIEDTEAKLQGYERELKQVKAAESTVTGKDTAEYAQKKEKLEQLRGQLNVYKAKLRETQAEENTTSKQTSKSANYFKILHKGLQQVNQRLTQFVKNGASKAVSGLKNLVSSAKRTNSQMGILGKTLKRIEQMIVGMIFYKVVRGGINAITESLGTLAKASPRVNANLSALMTSLSYLKNSLATAFAPILNVVTPILTSFMDTLSAITDKIAQFIAALTGKSSYDKAIKVQRDYAASLDDTTSAAEENTKAAKENEKSLAGYDELNVMQDNSSSDKSSDNSNDIAPSDMFTTANITSGISDFANKLKEAFSKQDFSGIGQFVAQKLNTALSKINWSKIRSTAKKWASNIADFLNGAVEKLDWFLTGTTIGNGIMTAVDFAYNFITGFNWESFGNAIANAINGLLSTINTSKFAKTISNLITGLLTAFTSLLKEIDWTKISNSIITFLSNIKWGKIGNVAVNLIKALANAIAKINFKDIGEALRSGFAKIDWKGIWDGLVNVTTNVIKAVSDFFGLKGVNTSVLKNALKNISKPISNVYKTLKNTVSKLLTPIINKLLPSIVNFAGDILDGIAPIIEVLTPISDTLINLVSSVVNSLSPVLSTIGQVIANVVNALTPIISPIAELITNIVQFLAPALDGILTVVSGIFGFVGDMTGIVGEMIQTLVGGNEEPTISAKLQEELDHLSRISEDLKTVQGNIDSVIQGVDESLTSTSGDLQYVTDLKDRMVELLEKSTLTDEDMTELNTIADLIDEKLPGFKETWNKMIEKDNEGKITFTGNKDEMVKSIENVISTLKQQYATEALEEQYKDLYSQKIQANKDVAAALQEITDKQEELTNIQDLYNEKVQAYYDAEQYLKDLLDGKIDVQGDLSEAEYEAMDAANAALEEAKKYGEQLETVETNLLKAKSKQEELNTEMDKVSGIIDVVSKKYDKNKDSLEELRDAYDEGFINADELKKQFNMTADELYEGSKSMAKRTNEGYAKGIDEGVEILEDAGFTIGSNVIKAAKKELGINSPSKEAAKIASYTIAGFTETIDKDNSLENSVKKLMQRAIKAMKNSLSSINFSAIFTQMWKPVKGVLNNILDGFENFFNYINSGLNSVINNLNTVSKNMGSVTGGKYTVYPNISEIKIPRLATGTVVPASYGEYLAVLGDNKREPEVVSPLSTMKQAVKEAISEINLGDNGSSGNEEINIYIDGDKVFKVVVDRNDRFKKSHGKSAFA